MQSKYISIGLLTVPVKARIEEDGKVPELMWYLVDEDCECRRYSEPPTVGATRHHKMKQLRPKFDILFGENIFFLQNLFR